MTTELSPGVMAIQEEMQALKHRNEQLMIALELYATEGNWKRSTSGRSWSNSVIAIDRGSRARSALFGLEE